MPPLPHLGSVLVKDLYSARLFLERCTRTLRVATLDLQQYASSITPIDDAITGSATQTLGARLLPSQVGLHYA
jgi:hypothetical protein